MKTARELLLERHQGAEPRLNALRQSVVDDLARTAAPPRHPSGGWLAGMGAWMSALRPLQRHWVALGAVWILAAVLNHESEPAIPAALAGRPVPAPHQILASLRENRRQLAELLRGPVPPTPPSVPQAGASGRRQEESLPVALA